jgi:hypothetical protein
VEAAAAIIGSVITTSRECSMGFVAIFIEGDLRYDLPLSSRVPTEGDRQCR